MDVDLTRREREVLNTTLSQEIYKMHLHYGEGDAPERLQVLYSLRDKLCSKEDKRMNEFKEGELIIYVNGDRYEIGKIKRLCADGAFVYYHEGDTAAKTPYDCMHKLTNAFCIESTTLGGGAM